MMRRMRLFVIVCLVSGLVYQTSAQSSSSSSGPADSSSSSSTGSAPLPPSTCAPLPSTSVCADFYPAGTSVDYATLGYSCMADAEASLATGPVIWSSLNILVQGATTCQKDFAQLMCLLVFRPCQQFISKDFCQATIGVNGTCPQAVQTDFLAAVIPHYADVFNCDGNPLFQSGGVAPLQAPAPADQCVPLNSNSICAGVIDYQVYLPWYLRGDQTLIEQQVAASFQSAMIIADVASGCLVSVSKMLCSMVYLQCDKNVLPNSLSPYITSGPLVKYLPKLQIPFPQLPCSGLCATVQSECTTLLASSSALAPFANCSGVGMILKPQPTCPGETSNLPQPNFPTSSSTLALLQLGNSSTPIPIISSCNSFVSQYPVNASSVITCPSPLVAVASPDDVNSILGGSCAIPCPSPIFTHDEWSSADKFFTFWTVLSFVSSLMLWLTWIVFPVKRKQRNTVMFNTCTMVLAFAMLIMIIKTNGKPSVSSCKNNSEYFKQKDGGMCIFEGIIFFYFTLAGVSFWFLSALDLYIKIVLNKKIDLITQKKYNRMYIICGWSIPFLFLCIALGLEAFGGTIAPWCFFFETLSTAQDWGLFYYPMIITVLVGSFFMASIMYKMAISARATGSSKKSGWWKSQIRPFLFILVFIIIFVFICGYRAHTFLQTDSYTASTTEWVSCLISTLGDQSACGAKPHETPNVGFWFMIQFAVGGQGFLNSLIFGSQMMNFWLWYGLLTGRGTDYRGSGVKSTGTTDDHNSSNPTTSSRPPSRQSSGRNLNLELGHDAPAVPARPGVHITPAITASTTFAPSPKNSANSPHSQTSTSEQPIATGPASDESRV